MSSTLIDSVKSVFTDAVITKFSTLLGEHESNTRKAVHAAIPAVLTNILHKAGNQEGGQKIYNLAKQAAGSDFFGKMHELSTSTGGLAAGSALLNKGTEYSGALLEGRADNVAKEISRYAGISVSSANFVTGVAGFAALDAIGRQIAKENLDVKGMVEWLATQRDSIIHAIPSGLMLKDALGINRYPGEKAVGAGRNSSLFIIIAIIIIAIIAIIAYKSCNQGDGPVSPAATDTTSTAPAPASPTPPPTVQDTLPDGSSITVTQGGTEDQLISFLSDPNQKIDSKNGNWFNFTGVAFDRNSANLLLQSETQLKNIVSILNAFPKAKIKIGGFSDNTGDSVNNIQLSQQRADSVLAKLKLFGAKPSQLKGAQGYGSQYPIGDNGTEAGRALNRRMAIDVKNK